MTDLQKSPLAVTMGEPAGIGAEITLMAWKNRNNTAAPYFLVDDVEQVQSISNVLDLGVPMEKIVSPDEALDVFSYALPILHHSRSGETTPGHPNIETAPSVISSIELATRFASSGQVAGIVTNPIQKNILYQAGFEFPGHTEFLAALCGESVHPVMMLACEGLRVVPISVHVGLAQAIADLTTERIVQQTQITWQALQREFSIAHPRLAVAGLNPHAGEDGFLGTEEGRIIRPAIEILKARGMEVEGPFPPDTLFAERTRSRYDAAICMYHDQALIPIKTLDFDGGVNITLGLPFVRTSPDHGTALEIAGQGLASPRSLLAALQTASEMARCRAHASA